LKTKPKQSLGYLPLGLHAVAVLAIFALSFANVNMALVASMTVDHRHIRNIDCLMARPTCLVCFISTVKGRIKKKEAMEALH
jgi:hypothetical protein